MQLAPTRMGELCEPLVLLLRMGELCEPNIYNISPQYLPTKIGRKNKIFYESAVSLFARILQTRVELRMGAEQSSELFRV